MEYKFIPSMSMVNDGYGWDTLEERNKLIDDIIMANKALIDDRIMARQAHQNSYLLPMVGDFYIKLDGTYDRFTASWDDEIQVGGMRGSFYLCANGALSYSGSLEPSIPMSQFELTIEVKEGPVWMFDRERSEAQNGLYFSIPLRVWRQKNS